MERCDLIVIELARLAGSRAASPAPWLEETLARHPRPDTIGPVDRPIGHQDVTTIMGLLGDIQEDVRAIRTVLEDDSGEEEEAPEDDA